MIKKLYLRILSLKYGLVFLVLLLMVLSFIAGAALISGDSRLSWRQPELTPQEKRLLADGQAFADGIYFVGSEIKPGIYRTTGQETSVFGCSWKRLSGFKAETNNVIASYYEDRGMPTIVQIEDGDKGFQTRGCGTWYAESAPVTDNSRSFGDGAFIVGKDIAPGVYKSEALSGCYWERLGGLSRESYRARIFGKDHELIASSNSTIVEIAPSDKGFISYRCKKWVLRSDSLQ